MEQVDLIIGGVMIKPGVKTTIDLAITKLYTHTPIDIPVHVIRGKKAGPILFVSAAIHGDEINGVEIIRRLLKHTALKRLKGTLIAVPVVNVHGFIDQSRYLPDRRDLNRSFPGSKKGSLAARLANLFMTEIVQHCTHGIDLHTGAIHRDNLPQIRAMLDDPATEELARYFSVPVLLDSTIRDGSLREAAVEYGIPMLVYEAGEALRFNDVGIKAGVRGVLNVMRKLNMIPASKKPRKRQVEPVLARDSSWVRAPVSGTLIAPAKLGQHVKKGDVLGEIANPFGIDEEEVLSPFEGIIIGRSNLPLANEGDALFHIARFGKAHKVIEQVEEFHEIYSHE
jgi:predicted deacylase